MFESVAIPLNLSPRSSISTSDLATSLLYYGQVNLVGGGGLIADLSQNPGTIQTLELIRRGYLKIHFESQSLGIRTQTASSGEQFHEPVKFGVVEQEPQEFIQRALAVKGWERNQAKLMANKFARSITEFHYPDYSGNWVKEVLLDKSLARVVIPEFFRIFGAESTLKPEFHFSVTDSASGLVVESDIDFDLATKKYREAFWLETETVTPALVLDAIRRAIDVQYFGATLNTEVLASPLSLAASSVRFSQVVERSGKSLDRIKVFEDVVFEGAGSIGSALTSGKRTFDEFLRVLERASKFKEWIRTTAPDVNLLHEYHRSIAEKTFLDKMPGKSTRFAFFTGGGLVTDAVITGGAGTAIGLALSAADSFLIERLGMGWKPHHFVTGELRKFALQDKK